MADEPEPEEAPDEEQDASSEEEALAEISEGTSEETAGDSGSGGEAGTVLKARRQPVQGRAGATGKGSFTRFVMIFLFLLAVVAIIDPGMAQGFGFLAGVVLYPVIGFGGRFPVLTVLLAGALTTGVSSILRDHYTDWVRMVRSQKVNAAWQKVYREAMRKGNRSQMDKLNKIRQGFMKDQMDIQLNSMKPLAWTFFLFIVLFAWLSVFVNQTLNIVGGQYFAVPWATNVYVNFVPFLFPSWILLYSLLAIPIGQILTRVLKYVRFKRRLDAMHVPIRPDQPETAS